MNYFAIFTIIILAACTLPPQDQHTTSPSQPLSFGSDPVRYCAQFTLGECPLIDCHIGTSQYTDSVCQPKTQREREEANKPARTCGDYPILNCPPTCLVRKIPFENGDVICIDTEAAAKEDARFQAAYAETMRNYAPEREKAIQAEQASPRAQKCRSQGGNWTLFGDGCGDSCQLARSTEVLGCPAAFEWNCDCGPNKCWNTRSSCEKN